MPILPAIFSFLIGAAGWYYLFNTRAAEHLASIEETALNARRIRLRRFGGLLLLILAMLFYIGFAVVNWDQPTVWFLITWTGVLILAGVVTFLALIDLRLTNQLRRRRKREES